MTLGFAEVAALASYITLLEKKRELGGRRERASISLSSKARAIRFSAGASRAERARLHDAGDTEVEEMSHPVERKTAVIRPVCEPMSRA